jgi:hypothetical protein
MKRMNLVMKDDNDNDNDMLGSGGSDNSDGGSGTCRKFECDNCRLEFPNKTSADRHMLFCRTLADIRRGGAAAGAGAGGAGASGVVVDDPLIPTQREMFVLIQELAAKYNKVKDELDVMKQWAKMVGRRIGSSGSGSGAAAAGVMAGLDFTSVTRQKRQNMEVILNEEDAEHPDLAESRLGFAEWLTSPSLTVTETDLHVVFKEDLVAGITAAILRVLSGYTAESGRSHLAPFKMADIKQGAFYIFDTAFKVAAAAPAEIGPDPPTRRWRAIEPCEFQLMVRTFHKLLFKEFKKWQDSNWEAQRELTKQRQKAASSYQQMMASCDGMYSIPSAAGAGAADDIAQEEPRTPVGGETVLSEDFATLYNKYADKMMGGALSDEAIVTKVRAKLWKDMKAWRL